MTHTWTVHEEGNQKSAQLSEPEKDGKLVIACMLDGEKVVYCPKDKYDLQIWIGMIGRAANGSQILTHFFPRSSLTTIAERGNISKFWNTVEQTGYYNKEMVLVFKGTISLE